MSTWGYKLSENDIALDVELRIEESVKERGLTVSQSIDEILSNKNNRECTECVLAIAEIEVSDFGKVVHKEEVKEALLEELKQDVLDSWGVNSELRKEELQHFGISNELL